MRSLAEQEIGRCLWSALGFPGQGNKLILYDTLKQLMYG